jgi:hypothetical protein
MKLSPNLFDGLTLANVERDLVAGKTLISSLGFTMRLDTDLGALVTTHPKLPVKAFNSSITVYKAVLGIYETLFEEGLLEGFQVENDLHDIYDRESFEILTLEVAVNELEEAEGDYPEDAWYISPIPHGTAHEHAFIEA